MDKHPALFVPAVQSNYPESNVYSDYSYNAVTIKNKQKGELEFVNQLSSVEIVYQMKVFFLNVGFVFISVLQVEHIT